MLRCKFAARALWSEVFFMFEIQWVMLRTIASLLFAWRNFLGKHSSNVWNMPTCLMWLIWRERNTRTFEDIKRSVDLLKSLLVGTLFEWSRIWDFTLYFFIFDFLQSVNSSFWFFLYLFWVQFVHHREHDVLLFNKDSITYPKKKRNLDGFTEDLKAYILCRDLALFESGLCCWV